MKEKPTDLRKQRLAVGLSQQRLAELVGCSIASVRLYERGYKPRSGDLLGRIQRVLTDTKGAA